MIDSKRKKNHNLTKLFNEKKDRFVFVREMLTSNHRQGNVRRLWWRLAQKVNQKVYFLYLPLNLQNLNARIVWQCFIVFRAGLAKKPLRNIHESASVPIIHADPGLKVSQEMALEIGKKDLINLIRNKKLVLLVDLDHTLIHTTNENVSNHLKVIYSKL